MQLMACDDVSQRPHGDFILVRDAAPPPCGFVKIAQQRNSGAAYGDEVFHQIGQRTLRERSIAHVVVLLEAFDGSGVSARDAQGAVGEDALGVADVSEDFLRVPLLRCVAEVAVVIVTAGEQQHRLAALLVKRVENVVALNQANIAVVVGRVFARLWPGDGKGWRSDDG